jgi:hypothetical protein
VELEKEGEYINHTVNTGLAVSFIVYQHDSMTQPIIEESIMQTLNEHFENLVHTADGELFDLFVEVTGGFQADDRGNIIYDADGNAISDISYIFNGTDAPVVHYTIWEPTENADTGGSYIMVPVGETEYNIYLESSGAITASAIYRHDLAIQPVIDERTMQILDEYLKDRVFTAAGDAFDLFIPVPGGFQADDKGYSLYDEVGRAIGYISYRRLGNDDPSGIMILTVNEVDAWFVYNDTYDEAVAFLGKDFRLPAIHTDGFGPPTFRKSGGEDYEMIARITGRRAVYVLLDGDPGMYFFVETNRGSETDAEVWHATDAVITMGEIAGVTVYKISGERMNRYTWTYNDLTYMFFQNLDHPTNINFFTDEQYEDIIRSMIE